MSCLLYQSLSSYVFGDVQIDCGSPVGTSIISIPAIVGVDPELRWSLRGGIELQVVKLLSHRLGRALSYAF